jgi:hypothetical protein
MLGRIKTKIYGVIVFPLVIGFFINTYISLTVYSMRKYPKVNSNSMYECVFILIVVSSTMIVYFK